MATKLTFIKRRWTMRDGIDEAILKPPLVLLRVVGKLISAEALVIPQHVFTSGPVRKAFGIGHWPIDAPQVIRTSSGPSPGWLARVHIARDPCPVNRLERTCPTLLKRHESVGPYTVKREQKVVSVSSNQLVMVGPQHSGRHRIHPVLAHREECLEVVTKFDDNAIGDIDVALASQNHLNSNAELMELQECCTTQAMCNERAIRSVHFMPCEVVDLDSTSSASGVITSQSLYCFGY